MAEPLSQREIYEEAIKLLACSTPSSLAEAEDDRKAIATIRRHVRELDARSQASA